MESIDIKRIWKSTKEDYNSGKEYSVEDIRKYRNSKSGETSRSSRRSIRFDIVYKSIIMAAMLLLMIILNGQTPYKIVIGILFFLLAFMIGLDLKLLNQLMAIRETDSLVENLGKKLEFIQMMKRRFVFISAMSNFFFVLTGFFLYFHFKYNEIRLLSPIEDPVLYLFLIAAFAISYFSQQPVYAMQIKELKESIEGMDDTSLAKIKIMESKKRRITIIILFSILILVGLLFLLFILFFNS